MKIEGCFISKDGRMMMNWGNVQPTNITIEEYNNKIDELIKLDYECIRKCMIRRLPYFIQRYQTYIDNNKTYICYIRDGISYKYCTRVNSDCNVSDEQQGHKGWEAYRNVESLWQSFEHMEHTTLYRYYSGRNYIDIYKAIKACVPTQISYIVDGLRHQVIKNCYKADVSSAFPSQLVNKSIPTLHDCKTINGVAKPTEEYPFAFYTKSNHLAIYNELDTRTWIGNDFYRFQDKFNNIKDEDEVTILCKKAEVSLSQTFEYLYNNRKVNADMKLYMNATIGFMHRVNDPRLAHIAAVVIARSNQNMLDKCDQLNSEKNFILYIATDSICWYGKESKVAINEKYLGSFTYEAHDKKFYGVQLGAYQMELDDGSILTKASYIKNGEDKNNIPFGKLPDSKKSKFIIDHENGKLIQLM